MGQVAWADASSSISFDEQVVTKCACVPSQSESEVTLVCVEVDVDVRFFLVAPNTFQPSLYSLVMAMNLSSVVLQALVVPNVFVQSLACKTFQFIIVEASNCISFITFINSLNAKIIPSRKTKTFALSKVPFIYIL
jgi:hypothetical protein